MSIYTLRNKTENLSLIYNAKKYVVIFKHFVHAHKVQYNITTDCDIKVLNLSNRNSYSYIYGNMMLSIPKYKYENIEKYFYIKKNNKRDILALPNYKDTGLLLPYSFEDETDNEFIFRTIMIDPDS